MFQAKVVLSRKPKRSRLSNVEPPKNSSGSRPDFVEPEDKRNRDSQAG